MSPAQLARSWAATTRAMGQKPSVSPGDRFVAEVQADCLEQFARALDAGAAPNAPIDDEITPPAGIAMPIAATQTPAGVPPAALPPAEDTPC